MNIRKIGIIGRTYRHIQRYRQILGVLFRYGFGDLVDTLKLEQYIEIGRQMVSRKRREKIERLSRAERVRMMLEELGPTFIKMGQVLSTRPDLLPVEFIHELEKLQDAVAPFGFPEVKQIVESELKAPLDRVFADFEEQPLAAASLGQVHRARLTDGDAVVVKVRRPQIQRIIEVDLEIMLHLASLIERHLDGWDVQRPTLIVEELAHTLERELDYTVEASYTERFAWQFTGDPTVYVPRVYRDATTSRVLTMEYVTGVKISRIEQLEQAGLNREEIARRGANLIMEQIFVHGFFHADPHPGNLFILPENRICYMDFGMMGRIDRQTREQFADFVIGIIRRDEAAAADALLWLAIWDEEPDRATLRRDVADFMDQHFYRSLEKLEMGKLLQHLLTLVAHHRMRLPPDLFLMLKALGTVEGLGRALDPNFDITEHAAPFLRRVQMERLYPRRIAADMLDSGSDLIRLLKEIPGDLRQVLRQVRRGRVTIELQHRGLEQMISAYDRISNRLSFAIVLASLVIGSSLIVLADVPPRWYEIPVIGLAGFVIAAFMGFWLLISILKH